MDEVRRLQALRREKQRQQQQQQQNQKQLYNPQQSNTHRTQSTQSDLRERPASRSTRATGAEIERALVLNELEESGQNGSQSGPGYGERSQAAKELKKGYGAGWRAHAASVVLGTEQTAVSGQNTPALAGQNALQEGQGNSSEIQASSEGRHAGNQSASGAPAKRERARPQRQMRFDAEETSVSAAKSIKREYPGPSFPPVSEEQERDRKRPRRFENSGAGGEETVEEGDGDGEEEEDCWTLSCVKNGRVIHTVSLRRRDPANKGRKRSGDVFARVWRVGRSVSHSDVRLEHSTVSRNHAVFELLGGVDDDDNAPDGPDGGGGGSAIAETEAEALRRDARQSVLCVSDSGSRRGTFVNGVRLVALGESGSGDHAGKPTLMLRTGDRVRFGRSRREFLVRAPRGQRESGATQEESHFETRR
jgi:pSer/pThr/pTyr-binding forkhead associated (FHA) protein